MSENDDSAERNRHYLRALDLHDETGQLLTAILINLQSLGRSASGAGVVETVRDTQDLVETLFYAIRNYIRDASGSRAPDEQPHPELVPALERLASDFSRRAGIGVALDLDPDIERIPGEHKAVFYRVVQESLTNVFRHTAAGAVRVSGSRNGASVSVEVEDDGGTRPAPTRGTGPSRAAEGTRDGSGLRGMRERVRLAGGECTVRTVPGRGTTVRVVLPYNIS